MEKLGWNIKNAKEVYPEFEVGDGKRVDYALFNDENDNKKPKVIIEVKRINADLDNAVEEQILTYARLIDDKNNSNPFICFATNGGRWKVYAYDPDKYNIDFFEEISIDKLKPHGSGHGRRNRAGLRHLHRAKTKKEINGVTQNLFYITFCK